MIKDDTLQAIENMLDSSEIPLNEYSVEIFRDNGAISLDISRKDMESIPHIYLFSEIFNSYTQDWYVEVQDNKMHLIVK